MQKLYEFKISNGQIITSDGILEYVKEMNDPRVKYIKTDFIMKEEYANSIDQRGWRNMGKTDISKVEVIITGHSDYEIGGNHVILRKERLKKWLCQNKKSSHEKLLSIPIGITNKNENTHKIFKIIGNDDVIYKMLNEKKKMKNIAYLNIAYETYPEERKGIVKNYKDKKWVTYVTPSKTVDGHYKYIENIYNHKFVFAPRGNGLDTHRLWESLYLQTIPIVKKAVGMEDFYDLPILFIDDWDGLTEEYLNVKYDEIMSKKYNMNKITLSYWCEKISSYLK